MNRAASQTDPFASWRSALPGLVWPALPDQKVATLAAVQQQLRHSQWWPPEHLARHQTRQLALLLHQAQEHVPYYRAREAYHDVRDWRSLPVLARSDLQQHYAQLKAERLAAPFGAVVSASTSGSTGTPVRFDQNSLQREMIGAFALRANDWHGRKVQGRLAVIELSQRAETDFPGLKQQGWGWPTDTLFRSGPAFFLNLRTSVEQQLQWLQAVDPHYLMTWPTNLRTLLEHAAAKEVRLDSLQHVTTLGETTDAELRAWCHDVWRVPLRDIYSSRETGSLAIQCPEHDHYHVMSENVRLEVLDDNDRPCPPGAIGRVVVTPLHSFAMPLLRYDLGDYAELGSSQCPCGRGLPVLRRILGRTRDMFYLPDGTPFWPFYSRRKFTAAAPIRQHQFVQTGPRSITVNLVVERALTRTEEQTLLQIMHDALPARFDLRLVYVNDIPRGPGGKYEYMRCDWRPNGARPKD